MTVTSQTVLAVVPESHPATPQDYKELIKQLANFEVVDRSILAKLINKIERSQDKEITITYNFKKTFVTA